MRISTTFFLAFLLSGLGLYYFVSEISPRQRLTELEPVKVLTLKEGDSVSFLGIERPKLKEKISFRRQGPDWRMEAPVSYPAENFLVEGMIDALTFSRRARRIGFKEAQAREFGFDSPEIKITVQREKEPQPFTLLLGEKSPVLGGFYAHWEGEKEYFLVPLEVKASFERSVYSLRQKKLFRFKGEEVVEMAAKLGEKEFRVEKRGEKWRWALPALNRELPLEKVSELVYAFQSLYVKEFLDGEKAAKKEFGSSFLALREKDGKEEKLLLGASESRKEALYALREGEDLLLLVSEKNLRTLFQTFETLFLESAPPRQG